MKKKFKGQIHVNTPQNWDNRIGENIWLKSDFLEKARTSDRPFIYITHPGYVCCEYKTKLNIFTFGKLQLRIPFHVIGLPVSIDESGFLGDLNVLIEDFRSRKGLFLVLNLKDIHEVHGKIAKGQTLCTCIFENKYKSFENYLAALRSSYRRRLNQALKKGNNLVIGKIANKDFDETLYDLYVQVLKKSKYPLEQLNIDFFKKSSQAIHVFYNGNMPLAFIMTDIHDKTLHFLLGGMDYKKRDEFDLYYNMLLKILKIGIENNMGIINFGQTAESSKCRIGCHLEKRYMLLFSKNRFINFIFRILSPLFEYTLPKEIYHAFI